MKKQLAILSVLAFIAVFMTGCEKGKTERNDSDEGDGLITVGFSQLGSESAWRLANTESMLDALSEENGFELIFDNARQVQENQFVAIRNFIQQEVDYIVIAPIEETGWDSVLLEAKEAGIPVIIVDRQVRTDDDSLYACWVGSDFNAEGVNAVRWLEKEAEKKFPGEALKILHIQGTEGATAQIMRTQAIVDADRSHDDWEIVATLSGEFTEAKGYEVVRDYLKQSKDFNVIYCENDNMGFGAMRALDEAGISYGTDGDVILITFDAVRSALQLCLDGQINLCVECNPLHGPRVAKLIGQIEAGETPLKREYVLESWFSTETLTQDIVDKREY